MIWYRQNDFDPNTLMLFQVNFANDTGSENSKQKSRNHTLHVAEQNVHNVQYKEISFSFIYRNRSYKHS